MSMKKKKPGTRWITGVQRAQLRKIKLQCNGILVANAKQPGNAQPLTLQQTDDFNAIIGDCLILLNLKS